MSCIMNALRRISFWLWLLFGISLLLSIPSQVGTLLAINNLPGLPSVASARATVIRELVLCSLLGPLFLLLGIRQWWVDPNATKRLSLRSAMVLITCCCVCLGIWGMRMRQQESTREEWQNAPVSPDTSFDQGITDDDRSQGSVGSVRTRGMRASVPRGIEIWSRNEGEVDQRGSGENGNERNEQE